MREKFAPRESRCFGQPSMKQWSQFFIPTLKESPSDAEIASHKLLIRAGLVRKLTGGLYTFMALLCVVAEAKDIFALERTSAYRGRYHVLGGLISPMDGIGPAQLRVKELIERVGAEGPAEVIIATNPNAEGEATALYLAKLISPSGVAVTRLAYGLPIGGDLDYADEITLAKALEGRRPLL